ncbi:MAG: TspO/MBR family protein [Candidatus Paceibacterota bacterium]|jgi:tryptophan-rich sensory protein
MELKANKYLLPGFILSLAVLNLVAGFCGSYLTTPYHPTRDNNNDGAGGPNGERFPFEPRNTPPSWVFATMWTFLYIGTAYAQAVLIDRVVMEEEAANSHPPLLKTMENAAAADDDDDNGKKNSRLQTSALTEYRVPPLLAEYHTHAILLHSWTFLFFGFKLYALALVSMFVLLCVAVDIFMKIRRPKRKESEEAARRTALATFLWGIYIAWLVFACALNAAALRSAYEAGATASLFLPVADVCEGTRMGRLIGTALKHVPSADLPSWVIAYCSVAGSSSSSTSPGARLLSYTNPILY